jgi:hypothetical protein
VRDDATFLKSVTWMVAVRSSSYGNRPDLADERAQLGLLHGDLGGPCVSTSGASNSRKILDAAARTCGARRLEDIRTTMSTMRRLAWREGWLPRSVDPLDGLKIDKQQSHHSPGSSYVDRSLRPETRMFEGMARAADHLVETSYQKFARFPLLGTRYRVAYTGATRQPERRMP